jgi:uncharacterized protein (TIGR03437 family)
VTLTGSGFGSTTQVGVVIGSVQIADTNITATVVNSTTITLAIAVVASDPYLPFSNSATSQVTIGVCNGTAPACTTATSTAQLTIGVNPMVQTVTSAAAFIAPQSPALLAVAPYDILTIFGTNFCPWSLSGCVSSGNNAVLYGQLNPLTFAFLTQLSPDSNAHNLMVSFYQHSSATKIADCPLLFATNNQINFMAPSALTGYMTNQMVDIVVSFGTQKSAAYTVTVAPTDPGVFTASGDGQGESAALNTTLASQLVGNHNYSAAGATATTLATDSDTIALYVTGLGVPDSDGSTLTYGVTCISAASYFPLVNAATSASLTSDDGLVLQNAWINSNPAVTLYEPCMKTAPTVTIGGVQANVTFAGWVMDSIAGLYQINVQLPLASLFTSPALTYAPQALPVVVTANGVTSQTGANLYVIERRKVTITGSTTVTCSRGSGCSGGFSGITMSPVATGSDSYAVIDMATGAAITGLTATSSGFALTSGSSGNDGTHTVILTVTDSSTHLTGSAVFTYIQTS